MEADAVVDHIGAVQLEFCGAFIEASTDFAKEVFMFKQQLEPSVLPVRMLVGEVTCTK